MARAEEDQRDRTAGLRAASVAALGAVALFLVALSVQKIWAADIWWQLRTGQWIVENRAFPYQDTLSYTAAGREWIEVRWLFCVLAYLGWKLGGPALLILAQTGTLLAAYLAALWPSRRMATSLAGQAVLVLGVGAAASRFVPRPELVSFLLVPVFLGILHASRDGRRSRAIWLLPFLQLLWVNAHTIFVFGPLLVWLFFLGDIARALLGRTRGSGSAATRPLLDLRLAGVGLLVTAACLANPYGLRGALFPFTLLREIHKGSILGSTIEEFISPFALDHWSWDLYLAVPLVLVTALTFLRRWREADPARLAVWGAFLYLGCVSLRNVAPLALVSTWTALRNLDDVPAAQGVSRRGRKGRFPLLAPAVSAAGHAALAGALLFSVWYVVSDRFYVRMGAPRRFGLGVVEWNTAAGATRFLLENGARPQVFHSLSDGSYLSWAASGSYPVHIDGRLEVYGEEFLANYHTLSDAALLALVDREGINTMILERDYFRETIIAVNASPSWALVYMDPRDLVYVRRIPAHEDLIRRHWIDPRLPWQPRGPEPEELPRGWRRWVGSVEQPWYSYSMARNFLAIGSTPNAVRFLERGLERFPDHEPMRRLLERVREHLSQGSRR